ncbi:hypothetical protein [Rubritalea tangerina]|uniref:hypothetical protein n=1 Tax=Rubritalea tangerina TaxID=430798 RepID=UPI00360F2657
MRLLRMSSGFSAKIAGPVVDALGIFNVVQGEVMTMGNKELKIELVTDHYFTFMGLRCLPHFFVFFRKRNVWHTVILVASVCFCRGDGSEYLSTLFGRVSFA